ncbi:MAG: NlpC/P60 family protein [Saccharofermentans sp.]|nr:NlpC/P60 family protein [Saccharofermentans sp.]
MSRKIRTGILAIAVSASVAVPLLCLPFGVGEDNPSFVVRNAYAAAFPPEENEVVEEVLVEEWALTESDYSTEGLIDVSNGGTVSATFLEGYEDNLARDMEYKDVLSYTVYQSYDSAGLPVELIDPQYFAPDNTNYYIKANNSILKEFPDMDSMTVQSLATGEAVTRIGIGDNWSKVQTQDGNEGYVLTDTLSYEMVWIDIDRTVWVDTGSLSLRAEPSTESEVVATLPDEARLRAISVSDKWYKVQTSGGLEGYVYISYTTQTAPPTPTPVPVRTGGSSGNRGGSSSNRGGGGSGGGGGGTPVITGVNGSSVVSAATSLVGVPYVYAGESASGVDCSGLVVYAYRQIGVSVPHYSQSLTGCGVSVSRSDIQPGDIVCYDYGGGYCGHVAIYVGGGQVVHASNSGSTVKYGNVDMMPIMTIRRIVT